MTQFLSSTGIVEQYLTFFRARHHTELPGSPLAVPGNSTSFIIAGMQPLLPYLRGQQKPPSPRLMSLQRCLRTDDMNAVGTNIGKNTSFFMLGNWSIGDYSKYDAIEMASDLLLNVFKLDKEKLWVTVFEGDTDMNIPLDEKAIESWQRVGMPRERIVALGVDDNFWTIGGGPGPCGPNSEIFVDRGLAYGCGKSDCQPGCSCDRFLEIWNLVFMEYERFPDGRLEPLPFRNIDTGMGLERTASVLQDTESVFSIDLFQPAIARLNELASPGIVRNDGVERLARRRILDHVRAVLLAELAGVMPERDGRGSNVRRLIRRAASQGRLLGLDKRFLGELVAPLAIAHGSLLTSDEHAHVSDIARSITDEERGFQRVLTKGLKYLTHLEPDEQGVIQGSKLFELHAEHGFPPDLAAEILSERGLTVDWSSYEFASEEHRRVSRLSAEKHFRGTTRS
ncbi:MAG TPA: hypothetical protein DHW02_03125 [Ktedonobacter sp.]|nr:hypothetical protein [Ktedonobacter sp.]